MATVLPFPTRPNTNSTGTSHSTFPSSRRSTSHHSAPTDPHPHPRASLPDGDDAHSYTSDAPLQLASHTYTPAHAHSRNGNGPPPRRTQRAIASQYPANSGEKHVEYILVASFDIDRGSVMEHQYPGPVGGDEHMLAELMLPDQTHLRSQDWTIFFLHKDAAGEEDEERPKRRSKRRRRGKVGPEVDVAEQTEGGAEEAEGSDDSRVDDADASEAENDVVRGDTDDDGPDGPPLVYVLNLVNTKQDHTVKRGAVVKAMAVCTRHSFLHIYKPMLLIALERYFANPVIDELANFYNAVNAMDLSLMPRLTTYERFILQSSDAQDLFIEKFEAIIAQRMASATTSSLSQPSPTMPQHARTRYGLPKNTHVFETVVPYANVPVPVKIPTAVSPETVGDFSLNTLITTFSRPHATTPQPFTPTHPHLTTSGPLTHPIIVLLNALLTQKRIVFLGHNLPSSEVADAVLAACALASGGLLRGFTRHAFPYTDLTKIDDLLKVPGFIAGVTNPAFALKTEWWDLLCDLPTGRMRISPRVEAVQLTEGVRFFQQPHPGGPGATSTVHHSAPMGTGQAGISVIAAAGASLSAGLSGSVTASALLGGSTGGDATGDGAFMQGVLRAIEERHGEDAVRRKFRRWVLKFTRVAAAFEEVVYGASMLVVAPLTPTPSPSVKQQANGDGDSAGDSGALPTPLPPEVTGHGYVWPSAQAKMTELAANATRIEGWRTTRSYYNCVQDMASFYVRRPVRGLDLQHCHDKLAKLRLGVEQSGNVYRAICAAVWEDAEIDQLLAVVVNGVWDDYAASRPGAGGPGAGGSGGSGGGQGQGLFYLALGLFHPSLGVREDVAALLGRVREHEAGRHFWARVGRFVQRAWEKVLMGREARLAEMGEGEGEG
ncbi:hypothetical protein LTR53_000153 [Teratosphaeriaceae sp. CCFEE 6253]|nr:hypothetical protein LTR53_000153 [Teratosphaeriaceae sp. CCFEE 6253]